MSAIDDLPCITLELARKSYKWSKLLQNVEDGFFPVCVWHEKKTKNKREIEFYYGRRFNIFSRRENYLLIYGKTLQSAWLGNVQSTILYLFTWMLDNEM